MLSPDLLIWKIIDFFFILCVKYNVVCEVCRQ